VIALETVASVAHPVRGAPFFLVANAGSGSASDDLLEQVSLALHQADREFKIFKAERSSELPRLAAQAARLARRYRGLLVAAGGDGTINAVAQEAMKSGCPFGVLPLGTFNYFARAHELPADPQEAVAVWLEGHCETVQVGEVNGHPFLVNASVGLYPKVLRAREADSARFGRSRLVAVWSALKTVLSLRSVMRIVTASERSIRHVWTPTLFVGNNALQLARLGLADAVSIGRGHLAAICVAPLSVGRVLSLAARAAFGRKAPAEAVSSELFRRMTVAPAGLRRKRTVQVACDGELRSLQAPLHFSVVPQALRLIKPRRSSAQPA
jgi:diacylglycerol kinase family enzyme